MTTTFWPHHLSALRIDRYLLGELLPAEAREVREHVASCAGCARAVELQRPEPLPPLRALRSPRRLWALGAVGIAAAASLVLLPRGPAERTKGAAHSIAMFVQHGDEVRRAGPGETVAPGDSIRFAVSSAAPAHLAVLSVDPAGRASIYFPVGPRAASVPAGSEVPLPIATRLDATVGDERILALFCQEPVELEPLRNELAQGRLEVPEGCEVVRWGFVKR